MAQTTQTKKINLSDFSANEKNVVGFNSYYSTTNQTGDTTFFVQQNKLALDKPVNTDKKVLLRIKDNATNKLQVFCYQVDGKNYAMIPKHAISEEAKSQLDNVLKDSADSESKEYVFEIEKIDLIDSSTSTKPKGFQLQLKGNDENKITINSNARALQISIDGKPIEQKQPEGNTEASVFGYSFTTSLIKDCFSEKSSYANIYTTNPTTKELQPATNISGFSTEFLLALANCHEKTTKPYSIIDYGDLKIFHAPLVQGIGGKANNSTVNNSLIFARIKSKNAKEKYKDYVLNNGVFKPVSQVAYTYSETNANDIGIDFAMGSSQATVELPIELKSNNQSNFINDNNFKIINAFSQFLANSKTITQSKSTIKATPEIQGGHIKIGEYIDISQADQTGFTEIKTNFTKQNVYSLNENNAVIEETEELSPDAGIRSETPEEQEPPIIGDILEAPETTVSPITPEEPISPIAPTPSVTADTPEVSVATATLKEPENTVIPEIIESSNKSATTEETAKSNSEQSKSKSNQIPDVKVKKEPSSLAPFVKILGTLGMIASLFLFVGAILVPGVAALIPAAIGCLCAGGALYFGSNFISDKMNFDSTLNSTTIKQRKRKNLREKQAEKFLKREKQIEQLRLLDNSMDAKTKEKRLAKAQKLEDKNFKVLASGNFRLIEKISQAKENQAIELAKQENPEISVEEIANIKQEARDKFINDNAYPIAQSVMNRRGEKATRKFLSACSQNQRAYILDAQKDISNAIKDKDFNNKEILGSDLSNYLNDPDPTKYPLRSKDITENYDASLTWTTKFLDERKKLEDAYEAVERDGNDPEELKKLIRREQILENESAVGSRNLPRNVADKTRAKIEEKEVLKQLEQNEVYSREKTTDENTEKSVSETESTKTSSVSTNPSSTQAEEEATSEATVAETSSASSIDEVDTGKTITTEPVQKNNETERTI